MGKKLNKIILLVTTLFLLGCTIDYNEESEDIKKSDTIPDSVMRNFKLIQIKNNSPHTEVISSLTEIYDSQNRTVLHDVIFTEYNTTTNKLTTHGKADTIEYFNDTEDAKLSGDLNFISKKDDIEMTGEYLYWDKEEKSILSSSDSLIKVVKDDGSEIQGFGFSANLKYSTFSFEKDITGITK